MRPAVALLLGVLALCVAGAASAAPVSPVSLEIKIDGVEVGVYDETGIGCSPGEGDSFQCSGVNLQLGGQYGLNLDSWSMTFDADPVVSGTTVMTNLSSSAQQFTLIFTLPTSVLPASLMGGSLQGGMTDNNGDGVTLSAPTGSAFYTALIDSVNVQQTLYADPSSFSAGGYLSGNVPNLRGARRSRARPGRP